MILAINTGSTSLKYKLFNDKLRELSSGDYSNIKLSKKVFKKIIDETSGHITDHKQLRIVHRVVNGGPKYRQPVRLTEKIINEIKDINYLEPLHNPYNLLGIKFAQSYFPEAKQFAVFDTGFYQDLPDKSKIYPIPLKYYTRNKIQRYGFHGTSHQFVLEEAKKKLKIPRPNLISLHLGGGCSITVIKKGQALDTSMGYTSVEGLMMWNRPGDIDSAIILNKQLNMNLTKWNNLLHYESGLKGLSRAKSYLDLIKKYKAGDKKAKLALDIFIYRIQKYVGAYYASLDGHVDAIVFTGKIGAGFPITRRLILSGLSFLKNVKKLVVQPNEEKMLAQLIINQFNSE